MKVILHLNFEICVPYIDLREQNRLNLLTECYRYVERRDEFEYSYISTLGEEVNVYD